MTMRMYAVAIVVAGMNPAASLADNTESSGTFAPFKTPAALPASGVDWTGFSIGLELGYASDMDGSSSPIYGAKLAWDYDFGNYIIGPILHYTRLEFDNDDGFELVDSVRLGVRGGIDSGLNIYYASFGYAELDTHVTGDSNPGEGNGYFVGLGYERFIREKTTLGAEVVYSKFTDFEREFGDLELTTFALSLNYRF